MAEINRMQYEIDYTEGISQRMRVPEMLKVAPGNLGANLKAQQDMPIPGVVMEVPERIVVAGQSEESPFSRPSDLDFISGTNIGTLALKTPPRVLTLSERPLDFLDLEGLTPATPQSEEIRSSGHLKRDKFSSENALRQNGQLVRHDSMSAMSTLDTTLDATADDLALADAASLRRQIIKLNRRLLLLEEENKERVKHEMTMYSIIIIFGLLNSWLWLRR
uniref:Mitochondrial fission factor homolog A n=2 Tax=Xenopus laevis TaxID=8355 RepID=MFF_XENLA|nr:RecName: Full=Mitochondrial fission factor homolog A [Xenopus laevis]AAH77775.1 MGC80099 protein [Xenopus laevis]